MAHPHWVLKHKKKGTEIRKISGQYYLYQVTSKWNPEKKRPRKITLGLIGAIKEDKGLVLTQERRKQRENKATFQVLDHGPTAILRQLSGELEAALKKYFPSQANAIYACALLRLIAQAPLKSIQGLYQGSSLSKDYPGLSLGKNDLSDLIRTIGRQREQLVAFFQHFFSQQDHLLFDATHLTSHSRQIGLNEKGYNSARNTKPQLKLLYMFSSAQQEPAYYRLVPGSIAEVSALRFSVDESGLERVIIIADKGFCSKANLTALQKGGLSYVMPLRRTLKVIDYSTTSPLRYEAMDGHFTFKNRIVWYKKQAKTAYGQLYLFYDGFLAEHERQDYLKRIKAGYKGYTLERFQAKQHSFGTFTLATNLDNGASAEELYGYYKARASVEQMFDTLKNTLLADKSYMRDGAALEGWMFINHICLMLYYALYKRLVESKLIGKYSPMDVLRYGSQLKKVKVKGEWRSSEVPSKARKIIKALNIHIP